MPSSTESSTIEQPFQTVSDLSLGSLWEGLLCVPSRFDDYKTTIDSLGEEDLEQERCIQITVSKRANSIRGYANPRRKGVPRSLLLNSNSLELIDPFSWPCFRLEIDAQTPAGKYVKVTVFGSVSDWEGVQPGDMLFVQGKIGLFRDTWQINSPKIVPDAYIGKIVPIYGGHPGKSTIENVTRLIEFVLKDDESALNGLAHNRDLILKLCGLESEQELLDFCLEANESPIREHSSLASLLISLHAPLSVEEGNEAIQIVKRICALHMANEAKLANYRAPHPDAPIGAGRSLVDEAQPLIDSVEQRTGFTLTKNQVQVIKDMLQGFQSDTPMTGLLSGEVGAGKTMAYLIPAAVAHMQGAKVTIIAPTLLLANQLANEFHSKLPDHPIEVERVFAGQKIKNPNAILVGTIGINSVAAKQGYEPDVIFFDEQHKLDTANRDRLVGPHTHKVEISATPIPRSLALSLYQGVTLFTLNEQPVEKDIQTQLIDINQRGQTSRMIRDAIQKNERVAIVYTLVDSANLKTKKEKDSAEIERRAAIDSYEVFLKHFPDKVVLLHGKMQDSEKEQALDKFRRGECPLMVTTTIFETGIDVPSVSVVVVRDPQSLGVSQLHQLRGRLARNGGKGTCVLLCENLDDLSEETYNRLLYFAKTNDGYALAVRDLKESGAGEFLGRNQRGTYEFVFKGVKKLNIEDISTAEDKQILGESQGLEPMETTGHTYATQATY